MATRSPIPTIAGAHPAARNSRALFKGYGWTPYVVEGDDPPMMHQQMAATLEHCVVEIRAIQEEARADRQAATGRAGR